MPRRPPSRQHCRDRRRGHRLRLHRVQRRAALDRRDERSGVHRDGPRRPRPAGSRSPVPQRLPRDHRRLPGIVGLPVLPRLPGARAGEDRVPAVEPAARRRRESGAARRIPRLRRPRGAVRAGIAAGDRDHPRSVRLRQDGADPGPGRADRRGPDSHRCRAQAAPRDGRAGEKRVGSRRRPVRVRCDRAHLSPRAGTGRDRRGGRLHRDRRRHVSQALAARPVPRPGGGGSGFRSSIIAFTASDATLRARVVERAQRATDASEADLQVLDDQLRTQEPLGTDELCVHGAVRCRGSAGATRAIPRAGTGSSRGCARRDRQSPRHGAARSGHVPKTFAFARRENAAFPGLPRRSSIQRRKSRASIGGATK